MAGTPYHAQKMEIICETPEVRAAEITLLPMSDTPAHQHTEAEEICYCLEGELTWEAEGQKSLLKAGERIRFAAGQDHRLSNRSTATCRFLLIHGVGKFDFVSTNR